ncbi:MAG: MarR family winged helix-turn-helix transcriptional regulator [Dermatophilaceae bacterium]
MREGGARHTTSPDDVDDIVAAWQRERPDLDVRPLQVLSRVGRLARRLDQARSAAFAAHELEIWEFDVLSALRRAGSPYELSPGRLAEATLVTSGTMTNRIDRLQARDLVTRRPSRRDRRGVIVGLTPAGLDCVDAALTTLLEHERTLLAGLDQARRDRLAELLRRLQAGLGAGER